MFVNNTLKIFLTEMSRSLTELLELYIQSRCMRRPSHSGRDASDFHGYSFFSTNDNLFPFFLHDRWLPFTCNLWQDPIQGALSVRNVPGLLTMRRRAFPTFVLQDESLELRPAVINSTVAKVQIFLNLDSSAKLQFMLQNTYTPGDMKSKAILYLWNRKPIYFIGPVSWRRLPQNLFPPIFAFYYIFFHTISSSDCNTKIYKPTDK